MSDDIELPELPEPDSCDGLAGRWSVTQMRQFARAAVLADRERRAQPAPGAESWRPIETAPKFQDEIDIWGKCGRYTNCSWNKQTYGSELGWVYESAYDCNGPVMDLVPGPTHWTPLPAPPAAHSAGKGRGIK